MHGGEVCVREAREAVRAKRKERRWCHCLWRSRWGRPRSAEGVACMPVRVTSLPAAVSLARWLCGRTVSGYDVRVRENPAFITREHGAPSLNTERHGPLLASSPRAMGGPEGTHGQVTGTARAAACGTGASINMVAANALQKVRVYGAMGSITSACTTVHC